MAAFRASVRSVLSKTLHGHFLSAAAVRWRSQALSVGQRSEDPDVLYQRLSLRVKGHDRAVLDSFEMFAALAARELGLNLETAPGTVKCVYVDKASDSELKLLLFLLHRLTPNKHIDKLTLLKSVHIFKKHRVQYEMRTHYRSIEVSRVTGSSAQVYLEYIQRNLPEGVAMEVTKTAIEKIPEHIEKPLWDD